MRGLSLRDLARIEADLILTACRRRLPRFRQLEPAIRAAMLADPNIDVFDAYEWAYRFWAEDAPWHQRAVDAVRRHVSIH